MTNDCPKLLSTQLVIFRVAVGTSWANLAETSVALSRPIEFETLAGNTCNDDPEGVIDSRPARCQAFESKQKGEDIRRSIKKED